MTLTRGTCSSGCWARWARWCRPPDPKAAAERLAEEGPFDLVLTDMAMPNPGDGLQVLQAVKARLPDTPVIVVTAFGNIEGALDSIQQGAFDYLAKPFDVDAILRVARRALEQKRLVEENRSLRKQVERSTLVGRSPALLEVYKQVARAAASSVPVLITGETGTGKEMVARALHKRSPRASGPVHPGGLRRHRRVADGERAVRPRARGLHGRGGGAAGPLRGGQRRHAVAGRDWRRGAEGAVPAAARAAGGGDPPGGRERAGEGGRAGGGGDEQGPEGAGGGGAVPRGSAVPAGRGAPAPAAAARATGGHRGAGGALRGAARAGRRAGRW